MHVIHKGLIALLWSSSLLYSADLNDSHKQETSFEELLTTEELEQIKQEAVRQSHKKHSHKKDTKTDTPQENHQKSDLLKKEPSQEQEIHKATARTPLKKSHRSSYTNSYRRYNTGRNRPADTLKSTPSQRTFGK